MTELVGPILGIGAVIAAVVLALRAAGLADRG